VATLFASFLGYNPIQSLLGPGLIHSLPSGQIAVLTGRSFFPHLMSAPFSDALGTAFTFSFIACLVAAWASWLRGGKYHHREESSEVAGPIERSAADGRGSSAGARRPGAVTQR
jgi:hypothetical protein